MPNSTLIGGHQQSLNSSKTEKLESSKKNKYWRWPKWLIRHGRKRQQTTDDAGGNPGQMLMDVASGQMVVVDWENDKQKSSRAGSSRIVDSSHQSLEDIVQDNMVCLLCLQVPKEWFVIKSCSCKFCLQCMEMYAHCSVRSGDVPITCPDGNCPLGQRSRIVGRLSRGEVRQLLPNDVFPLYLRLQINTEVADNPTLVWCPRPGCETICKLKEEKTANTGRRKKLFGFLPLRRPSAQHPPRGYSVECPSCQHAFCSQCKTPWHSDAACPSLGQLLSSSDPNGRILSLNQNESDSSSYDPIAQLERDGRIKRCPFCQVPIERDDGCAQMMCKNCRHVFCWFCLASLDDDFMLRHYDSGPCRSRLGHSRVSVVWHRTQVVSAFLGLGVLFLLTSPLLLLASPCFFCWRRHSHKTKKNDGSSAPSAVGGSSQEDL